MAKIKNTMTVSLEEFGKKAGEYALDEFEYKGLTIRQWADKIASGEYQPVKQGTCWVQRGEEYYCSHCGGKAPMNINRKHTVTTKHCPHCGYKMG